MATATTEGSAAPIATSSAVGFLSSGAMPEGHLSIPSDIQGPHASKDTTPSPTEGQLIGSLSTQLGRSSLGSAAEIGERAHDAHARTASSDVTSGTHAHSLTNGHAHTHSITHGLAGLSLSEHASRGGEPGAEQSGEDTEDGVEADLGDDKGLL